jgi:hypothetical protein
MLSYSLRRGFGSKFVPYLLATKKGGMTMEDENKSGGNQEIDRRLPPCTLAAEWAEHARSYLEDEPCDDGRAGHICGRRDGEEPCPI